MILIRALPLLALESCLVNPEFTRASVSLSGKELKFSKQSICTTKRCYGSELMDLPILQNNFNAQKFK